MFKVRSLSSRSGLVRPDQFVALRATSIFLTVPERLFYVHDPPASGCADLAACDFWHVLKS